MGHKREGTPKVPDPDRVLRKVETFIRDAVPHLDPKDPRAVRAVTAALSVLYDAYFTRRVLEARLSGGAP